MKRDLELVVADGACGNVERQFLDRRAHSTLAKRLAPGSELHGLILKRSRAERESESRLLDLFGRHIENQPRGAADRPAIVLLLSTPPFPGQQIPGPVLGHVEPLSERGRRL